MNRALEDDRLDIADDLDVRGQRIERVEHLRIRARLGPALPDDVRGQRGQAFLAGGIVDGAGLEVHADRDQRVAGRLNEHGPRLTGGGLGLAGRGGRRGRGRIRGAGAACGGGHEDER